MVCACSLKNWREALALLLTYSEPEKFPELCGRWPLAPGWSGVTSMESVDTLREETEAQPELWEAKPCRQALECISAFCGGHLLSSYFFLSDLSAKALPLTAEQD